jgi:hypothetical protein
MGLENLAPPGFKPQTPYLVADCCNNCASLAPILNHLSPHHICLSNFYFHTFTFTYWSVIGPFSPSSLTFFYHFLFPPSKLFQAVKLMTCIYEVLSFYIGKDASHFY